MKEKLENFINTLKGVCFNPKVDIKETEEVKIESTTFEDIENISNYNQQIISVKASKMGEYVACVYCDGTVIVYNSINKKPVFIYEDKETKSYLEEHNEWRDAESSLAFSHDAGLLAYGRGIGKIKIFDIKQHRLIHEYQMFGNFNEDEAEIGAYFSPYTYVAFSSCDRFVIAVPTARFDPNDESGQNPKYFRTFALLDTASGDPVLEHTFEKWKIGSIAFSKDDKYFACAQFGGEIIVWDICTKRIDYKKNDFFWLPDSTAMKMSYNIVFDKQQNFFYTTDKGIKKVKIHNLKSVMFPEKITNNYCYAFMLYDDETKLVAALRNDIVVWNVSTGKLITKTQGCNLPPP